MVVPTQPFHIQGNIKLQLASVHAAQIWYGTFYDLWHNALWHFKWEEEFSLFLKCELTKCSFLGEVVFMVCPVCFCCGCRPLRSFIRQTDRQTHTRTIHTHPYLLLEWNNFVFKGQFHISEEDIYIEPCAENSPADKLDASLCIYRLPLHKLLLSLA